MGGGFSAADHSVAAVCKCSRSLRGGGSPRSLNDRGTSDTRFTNGVPIEQRLPKSGNYLVTSALSKVKIGDSTFPIQHLNWRKSTRNAIHDLPPILKLSFDAALVPETGIVYEFKMPA